MKSTKKIMLICGIFVISVSLSYFYGLVSHKYYLQPFPQILYIKNRLFPESIGYADLSSRKPAPCSEIKGRGMMVALAFGQSNSGNHGETLHRPARGVFNFYKGRCYVAEDPLLGATGDRGSIWSRLGDLLVRLGLYDAVVIIPIGVGTTTVDQWTKGGYLHSRIVNAIRESGAGGLKITHLFWVQGGSEKRTNGDGVNKENYKTNFSTMLRNIRNLGVQAPMYIAVSTYNGTDCNRDIQKAQRELVDGNNNVFAGPDDDQLLQDPANRWEQVHLSNQGLDRCALAWLAAIRRAGK